MSKRLNLTLEDREQSDEEQHENREKLEKLAPSSAKRYKTDVKPHFDSPMPRMLQRQIASSSTNTLSPITELSHNMRDTLLHGGGGGCGGGGVGVGTPKSSMLRTYNSVSSYDSSNSLDDEYMAMFELETLEELPSNNNNNNKLPVDLAALMTGQLKTDNEIAVNVEQVASKPAVRRCLSMSQQEPPPLLANNNMPLVPLEPQQQPKPAASQLRKTMSMNDADILNALNDEPELIGDLSKPCALPVLLSGTRHRDLKTISCDTLARLLRGEFEQLSGCFKIIDCRYPYEYDGGHITGALNLYTRAQIKDVFPNQRNEQTDGLRHIYIFHCEFSSERGPKLMRYLRNNDRNLHTHNYPSLDYPELYLLNNGYKEFHAAFSQFCEPDNYVPMLSPAYNQEYRLFRAKTKSWQCGDSDGGDSGIGGADGSGLSSARSRTFRKSRSRLLYAE